MQVADFNLVRIPVFGRVDVTADIHDSSFKIARTAGRLLGVFGNERQHRETTC